MQRHSSTPARLVGSYAGARPAGLTWADLGLTPEALDWHADAACRETAPDAFYPEPDDTYQLATITAAKRVCQGCPVRAACLEYAQQHGERHGIWGGLTPNERRDARRATRDTRRTGEVAA